MLHVPNGSSSLATIMGIDPGSNTLGISLISVDVVERRIIATHAHTITGERLGGSEWVAALHGDRFRRIDNLGQYLHAYLCKHAPLCVAVEAPFFNPRRPYAYGVLMEVMAEIRAIVRLYDYWQTPYLIDPSSVKNAVGAPGNAKKEVVRDAIFEITELNPIMDLGTLDEHSLDAIAVAYTRVQRFFLGEKT